MRNKQDSAKLSRSRLVESLHQLVRTMTREPSNSVFCYVEEELANVDLMDKDRGCR